MLNSIRIGNLWKENFHSFTLCCPHFNLHIMRCDGNFRKWFSKFSKTADARYGSNRKYDISEQGRFAHIKSRRIKAYWTVIRKAKSVTKWTSSDSKIVTVDDGGRVDALKEGTALISAISKTNQSRNFRLRWQNQPWKNSKATQPV